MVNNKIYNNLLNEWWQVKFGQIAKWFNELYKNRKALVSAAIFATLSTNWLAQAEVKLPQNILDEVWNVFKKPQWTQMGVWTLSWNFILEKTWENQINIYKWDKLVYVVLPENEENNNDNIKYSIKEVKNIDKSKSSLKQAWKWFLIDITSNASVIVWNSWMYWPTANLWYASEITNTSAIALELEWWKNLQRFLTTIWFSFWDWILMFSWEHLWVNNKFQFSSEEVEQMVRQNSFGTAFKMHFSEKILKSLELSWYITKAQSYELINKEYTINNDTLFAIYDNYRNIAGWVKKWIQGKTNFKITKKWELILWLNYETL